MEFKTGARLYPTSVSVYSTLGGTSAKTSLFTRPSSSIERRFVVSTFCDIPLQAFFKVVLPQIMPGVISGMTMAFTMSLDDFVISYFVYGPSFSTLPIEIYAYTKRPIPPTVYALFTVLFVCILLLLILQNVLQARDEKKQAAKYA